MSPYELLSILKLLSALAATPAHAAVPHPPPTINIQESLGDTASAVLRCYHPSGRLEFVNVIQAPWALQGEWNATSSAELRIQWRGLLNTYISVVAVMERKGMVHAVMVQDGAILPANRSCALDGWVEAAQ